MSITATAKNVIERPLDKGRIKQRPGRGNMTFDYIPADYVISLLNEAFAHTWDTQIISHIKEGEEVIVCLELSARGEDGTPITKQQFGSCTISRGVGPGDAFKGAASDALKKAATLFGIGLELYQDEAVATASPTFQKPNVPVAPPRPAAPAPARPVPAPPRPVAPPQAGAPPFNAPANPGTATVPVPRPVAPPVSAPPPPAREEQNPFSNTNSGGITSTQLNALTNLATRNNLSQPDLIGLASIVDDMGHPVTSFEQLTKEQAIAVIRAAQQQ